MRVLLDAYGAHSARWPADERDAALDFLAESVEARALHDDAARLDAAFDLVPAPPPSAELIERIAAEFPRPRPPRRWTATPVRIAAAALLAVAAAVCLWVLPGRLHTTVPTKSYAVSYQGRYTTPTDVLLTPPGFDLSRTAPTLGCVDGGPGMRNRGPDPSGAIAVRTR
jgi:hypothetical protein